MNRVIKFFFIFFSSALFLIVFSCPQDLVKGTAWTGTLTDSAGKETIIDAYFQPDYMVKMYFQNPGNPVISYSATGEYALSAANSLDTTLYGNGYFEGSPASLDNFTLEIEGELNNSTGIGSGGYVISVNRASDQMFLFSDKGDWELTKIKSY